MIKREFRLYDADDVEIGYVEVDESDKANENVGVALMYDGTQTPSTTTVRLDEGEFNDLVVLLNEAAKYFGYELVMSPIKKALTEEELNNKINAEYEKRSLFRGVDDCR